MSPNLREKHAEETRRALLRAARRLFARHGYAGTGIDQIAAAAGATRGAVYHHFDGKEALVLAVLDEMQAALAAEVVEAAAQERDPWARMRVALATFLEACTRPAQARILLEVAPEALGWETWREVDDRHFLGLTREGVRQLVEAGAMPPVDPDVFAHLLMALLTEAALLVSRHRGGAMRARVDEAVEAILGALASAAPGR